MAGDFSRTTVNRVKRYAGVLMQQGRVQVDADWNEQLALQLHRTWTEARDVIGRCGTPQCGSGFAISSFDGGIDLLIHPGRFYVNGLLCELEPQTLPAWLTSSSSPTSSPRYMFMDSGKSMFEAKRRTDAQHRQKSHGGHGTGGGDHVVYVPSKMIDDRELAKGDWVEIFASGGTSVTARVTKVAEATTPDDTSFLVPSYFPLTVDRSLSSLANAGQLSLRRVITFTTQPYLLSQWDEAIETSPQSGSAALNLPDGNYLVVLEAWQREINALEDPHIREVALGGPDTCERLQTAWQIHVLPWSGESSPPGSPLPSPLPSPPSPLDCCSDFPNFDDYKAATRTTGLMNAQAPPPGNNVPPCQLPPSAGYLGLANQLYRVEIFRPGNFNDEATFVWSRDNAMVETSIACLDASGSVYVSSLGKDDLHSFTLNDWVEIVDDDTDLQGQPRFLAQISEPPASAAQPPCASAGVQAYQLTLQPAAPVRFQNKTNLRLRRWDMTNGQVALDSSLNPIGIPIVQGWTQLENNIQVNFSDGFYASRSYWQIPARTATGDIEWPPFDVPNSNPIPQPPLGPDHFFCRLALLTVGDGDIQVTDCRCTFPSLNSICAQMEQALEERDALHRLQNRTLHGSGVVCGLAVTCPGQGQSATSVSVAPGYAIDCEGYDLILSQSTAVDVASLIDSSPPSSPLSSPQEGGLTDGEYELLLERSGDATRACHEASFTSPPCDPCCSETAFPADPSGVPVNFRLIPCENETFVIRILDGTLPKDFFTRCVEPLFTAFRNSWMKEHISQSNQITDAQALMSALTNLLVQLGQPELTKEVYISAREAVLLEKFYKFLLDQITDCTYCTLKQGLTDFPEYPLSQPMYTIYGKGYMTRLRVAPRGEYAIACGNGPNLHLYSLGAAGLVSVATPPIPGDSSGWTVRDVAFLGDGRFCAIATGVNTLTNASDSVLAIGAIHGTEVTWAAHGSAGAHSYLTLASIPQQSEIVYAAATGSGIFAIPLGGGFNATQFAKFNAIGHLVYSNEFLYATAIVPDANGSNTYVVQRYVAHAAGTANEPQMTLKVSNLTIDLTDDLAVGRFATAAAGDTASAVVFITGKSSATSTKHLVQFNASDKGQQVAELDLAENTTVRLAIHPYGTALLVSFEDSSRMATVAFHAAGLAATRYAPVELHPTSMTFGVAQDQFFIYTLNSTANTISSMLADTPAFEDYENLLRYRVQAIRAFVRLAEALLQYLKDCFCKLLLPKCATCDDNASEGKGVALACITIKNGTVQKICNLEKRKIVKTFPTVGYWLSLIPVIPLVKVLVQQVCCGSLPGLFEMLLRRYGAKQKTPGFSSFSSENFRYALSQTGKLNFSSLRDSLFKKTRPVTKLTLDSLVSPFRLPSAPEAAVPIGHINGMPLEQAKAALQGANVQLAGTETYNPASFAQNMGNYISAPEAVQPGSSVTLIVDSGNTVRYYVPTPPAIQDLSTSFQSKQAAVEKQLTAATELAQQLQTRVAAVETTEAPALQNIQLLQNTVSSLQTQITTMQASHAGELASRDQQIAQLTATTQQMQAKLGAVDTLNTRLQELEHRLPPGPRG